jgi:hypothetical protein
VRPDDSVQLNLAFAYLLNKLIILFRELFDVLAHSAASFSRLVHAERLQNIGMPDPARHCLGTERIETRHIGKSQTELAHYSLISGECGSPTVTFSVRTENVTQLRPRIALRGIGMLSRLGHRNYRSFAYPPLA